MDVTLAKDHPDSGTPTSDSATQEASFGRHRKLDGDQVSDNYQVEELSLRNIFSNNNLDFKYGPQSLTQMDKHLYIGGAIRSSNNGAYFCPVLAKVTMTCEDIHYKWPEKTVSYENTASWDCTYINGDPTNRCPTSLASYETSVSTF